MMRPFVLSLALPLALAGCAAAPPAVVVVPATPGSAVRVVSYNIFAGKDEAGQPNLERVAALLDTLGADIVLLQEVDRRTARSGGVDQLAELERLTGLHGTFGRSLDYQGGEYGIAILARWPIAAATVVPLTVEPPQERSGASYEPRVTLHAVVASPAGPIHVLNTHLDPGRAGTYRRQELIGLMARAAREVPPDAHLIVGGDLNTRPDTDEIAALRLALRDAWDACGTGPGETFPASRPDRRIDYLFIRGGQCVAARVPPALASDHRPVFLLLQLP
jgi:endonuclease/exonuclease/phosphatase family metal-dependent hydrolase